ncbi:MAG: metallophosphoesterase family protein [Verrucomicrobia bacterium]|nr:metallophosphoesterase family protein [Verrucomicrobiota bacterium]
MKIGIISDTHGQVDLALSAAREFIFRGVEAVLHCGDIGCDMVLTEMAAMFHTLGIRLYAVLGNCDIAERWDFYPEDIGVEVLGRFGELELAGKKIAIVHSDDERAFADAAVADCYDYLFSGHSHVRHDKQICRTRLINPGAAGRGMHPSCAVLDLVEDQLDFFTIRRSE